MLTVKHKKGTLDSHRSDRKGKNEWKELSNSYSHAAVDIWERITQGILTMIDN